MEDKSPKEILDFCRTFFPNSIEKKTETEYFTNCIWHNDPGPSLAIDPYKATYYCFGCGRGGSVYSLMSRNDADKREQIPQSQIAQYHTALLENTQKLKYLTGNKPNQRGLSLEIVKRFKLGYDEKSSRIVIPIPDVYKNYYYLRKYHPKKKNKMIWYPTGSQHLLYPISTVGYDEIIITEGELDALKLLSEGFPALTLLTGSQTRWKKEWDVYFKGKTVYVVYDRDSAGVSGAKKIVNSLKGVARNISRIKLPIPLGQCGHDVSDYFSGCLKCKKMFNFSAEDFDNLLHKSEQIISYTDVEKTLIGLHDMRDIPYVHNFLIKYGFNPEEYDLTQGKDFRSEEQIQNAILDLYGKQLESKIHALEKDIRIADDDTKLLKKQLQYYRVLHTIQNNT